MRVGPITPGSIREAIIFRYWHREKSAKLIECLLPILVGSDSDQTKELYKRYVDLTLPVYTDDPEPSEDMQITLKDWMAKDIITFGEHTGTPEDVLPPEWATIVKQTKSEESMPASWRGKKVNYGRRKNKV